MSTDAKSHEALSQRLEELLEVETFPPPEEFARDALRQRPGDLPGGRRRPAGVVGEAGPRAGLVQRVGHDARRLKAALLQVVHRRHDQRLLQLPGSPRRGRQRRPDRVSLARRGGRGARHLLRRPAPRRPALRQRAEGPGHRAGRRRRDLPADDPRGHRRDARLRADRRTPQRRLRRLLARVGQGAHGGLRGQGAHHRRRRAAQGQDGADQGGLRRGRDAGADDDRRAPHRHRLPDGRRRRLLRRDHGGGRRGVRGRGARRRAPALHPVLDRVRRRSRRASCTRPAAT